MTSTLDVTNGYIKLPITTTPNVLFQNAIKEIATALPGWVPRESHIEVLLLEQFAAMCAETANVAAQVPLSIFTYYGTLVGIVPSTGNSASCLSTWRMVDDAGYTVPAGTLVGFQILGNQIYTFKVATAFTVPLGTLSVTGVSISATSVGTSFNGLTPQALTLVNPALAFVRSITSTTTTSGGENAETTTQYLNRLSNELQLLTPRPILTPDFALLAATVDGVYRATAFNNLNPFANQLSAEDSTFSGGLGTWSAVSGCTVSDVTGPSGEACMEITCAGSASAIVNSGAYAFPQTTTGGAVVSLDYVSTARHVTVAVEFYNVSGTLISTTTGNTVTESTAAPMTFALVNFTSPANTVHLRIKVTVATPVASELHYVAFPALFQLNSAPVSQVPDSNMVNVVTALSWILTGLVQTIIATGQYGAVYTGTGSASGTKTAISKWFRLPAGQYFVSAYINAQNVTSGSPECVFTNATFSLVQTAGTASTLTGTFTLASPTMVSVKFNTNNCTVQSGLALTFASPFIKSGATSASYSTGPSWGPANATYNNERMVTVAAVDQTGNALDSAVEANVASYLESLREVNFVVNVIGPSYTTIDVTWAGFVATANPNTVQTIANAALRSYLSPADWAGGTLTPPIWTPTQTVVRYLEVATVLGETPGLTLTSLTIGYHGGTQGTSNLTLAGFAPLPKIGTINSTVTQTA